MRVTRYLWINNLPARATEQDIRDVLQSHGKIQSVRIHADDGNYGAVVAFVDTKSATRAIESAVKLKKVQLSLQYCESSGNPGNNSLDQLSTSLESVQTSNNASILQLEDTCSTHKGRSVNTMNDSNSTFHDSDKKEKSHNRLKHSSTPRTSEKETDLNMDLTPPRYSNEYRGLKISHLPLRSSDTNLREGLFHEYKKHGKITSVTIRGQDEDRICIITFRRSEDAEKALALSQGKVFFGTPISVTSHEGLDTEDPDLCPPEHALDEYHPKATKTLFVGNLCSNTITQDELRRTFRIYGEIIEIDIKVQANQPGTSYAFVQYGDIKSVVRALHDQESIRVNGKPVKLGFGKSQPTNVVWLDNLAPTINETYLSRQFGRYGHLTHVILDRKSLRALLYFDTVEMAQRALNETRNRAIIGRKVQIDYAGYECQVAFMRKLTNYEKIGQVYENYKEHLQEFLALWPSYSGVLPILGDRPRYFNETHRDNATYQNENPKFSHRKFNNFRHTSPERSQKQDVSNKTKGSPRRGHQSSVSSDRRRTFTVDSLEDPRCSPQTVGWSNSNCSRSTGKLSDIIDHSADEEIRSSSIFHRRRLPKASPDTSPHKSSSRRTSHNELRSKHCDIMNASARGRSHLLEETDDISSGSFSSGFTANESPLDASPTKPHSSGSAEGTDSESKSLLHTHRGYNSYGSKRRTSESSRLQNRNFNRQESAHLDDPHSSSARRHYPKYKNSVSPCPNTHTSRSSVVRSQKSVQRSHLNSDKTFHSNSLHNQHGRGKPEESLDQRLTKVRSHGHRPTSSKSSAYDDGDSDTVPVKDKHSGDVDYTTGKQSTSNSSPSENSFKRNEEMYSTNRSCDPASVSNLSATTVGVKSHDTLTKLELERAKLLRELSLLNDEVIGSGKSKPVSSLHSETRPTQKRTSCAVITEVPSPKLKRYDSTAKMDDHIRSPTGISNHTPILTSPTGIQKSANSTDFRMNRVSTPLSYVTSPHSLTHTSTANQHHYFNITQYSHSSGHNDPDSPPLASHLSSPYPRTTNHNSNKSVSVSCAKTLPMDSIHTPIQGCPPSSNHQQTLIASSPKLIVPPEPTSPLSNISPPHSPNPTFVPCVSTSSKLNSVNYGLNQNPSSGSRDPRLALHNQNMCDIPPPPPETFKLPLWVDTSTRMDTSPPANHHTTQQIYKSSIVAETSKLELSSLHCETESETSLTQDSSVCSLDERIRLLDVQLMKSEKARPVVDYSKFRIRRKVESNTTTTTQSSTLSTNVNLGVPSTVTSSYSPNLVMPGYVGSRTEFTSPDSTNASITSMPPITTLITSSSTGGSVLTVPTTLSLVKPADTSEFVKSMLSSTKSPSTTCVDAIANSAVDQVGVTSRLLSPSPSTADPFGNRLPRESALKGTSIGIVTPASSTFGYRPANNIASRFHIPSGTLEHNSLSGMQPVGVATRLPLSSDLERSAITPQISSNFKPILKRESNDSSESSSTKTVDKKSPLVDLEKTDISHQSMDKKISCAKSPEECSNNHAYNAVKTSSKCSVASIRTNVFSGPSRDTANRTKPKQSDSTNVSVTTNSSGKPVKRSTLDNSVFDSWKPALYKGDKLKKCFPGDTKQVSSDNSLTHQNQKDKMTHKLQTKLHKNSKKKTSIDQEPETGDIIKQKPTEFRKLAKTSIGNSAVRARDKGSRKSPPKKKKRMDNRKKVSDSDESDWEPDLDDDLPDITNEPMVTDSSGEQRYESMYDKIKRRASKNVTKSDPKSKPDSMLQLVKSRNKQTKGIPRRVSRKSPVDSDTDECLSEDSIYADKSVGKTSSPEPSQKVCKQKMYSKTNLSSRAASPPKRKKQGVFSSLHNIPTTELAKATAKKKGKKSTESILSTSSSGNIKRKSKPGMLADSDEGNIKIPVRRTKNVKSSTITRPHSNGKPNLSIDYTKKCANARRNLNQPNSRHEESSALGAQSNNVKSSSNARRNLVRRVFASTDSSSLSSSVCSEDSDDDRFEGNGLSSKPSKDSVRVQNNQSSHSRSSTPCISRSCSPEDLGADAAVRHTFGAFATPFNSVNSEFKPNLTGRTISRSDSSEDKVNENPSLDQATDDSKPTPPTLPMTDSSFSADHQSSTGLSGRFGSRDPSEWNIFTSLAKQSTPKHDEHRLKHEETSSSSTSDHVKENMIQSSNCESESAGKLPSDIDDDLPSLEKHDEDEINKSDGCSILLNDSSNLNHNLNEYTDDDLPPPVVPAIGPPLCFTEGSAETTIDSNSVIIEEVVYDGLEVPVSETDVNVPVTSPKMTNVLCVTKSNDIADNAQCPEISESAIKSDAPQDSVTTSETQSELSRIRCEGSENFVTETPVSSVAALSLHSTVLTPLAMLATSSTELSKSGQPIIVTISGSGTAGPYNPSNIALISKVDCPTSQPCPNSPQVPTSVPQRHITFILPAPKVSFNAPFQQPPTSSISNTVVSAISESKDTLPMTCTPTTTLCSSGQANSLHHTPTNTHTVFSGAGRHLPGGNTPSDVPCTTTQPVSPSPVQPLGSTASFDQSDIASYVQRVIERVKQEKDEETLHQREKTKRTKKNLPVSVSFMPTTTNLSSHVSAAPISGTTVVSCVAPLPLIAPLPSSTLANTCTKQLLQPHPGKIDNPAGLVGSLDDMAGGKVSACLYPNETRSFGADDVVAGRSFDPNLESNSHNPVTISHPSSEPIDKDNTQMNDTETNLVIDDCGFKDSVDEVIDAVLSGHFDENEYTQKLIKGTFLGNHVRGPNFVNASLVSQSDPTLLPEQSNSNTDLFQQGDSKVSLGSNLQGQNPSGLPTSIGTIKNPTDYLPNTSNPSPGVLTPMHVLTFVATCVAPSTSHVLCNPTIVSPTMPNQTTCTISGQNLQTSAGIAPVSSSLSDTMTDRASVGYVPTSEPVDMIPTPTSGCSRMEHFAHLASNSLTYFYSFLAQRRLSPSISPSIVSNDSVTSRTPENLSVPLCVPAKVQGSLKGLSLPDVSVGSSTADYLATMAAMAAMATPSSMGNTGDGEAPTFNQSNCTSFSDTRQVLKEASWNDHLLTQDHPPIWSGRLSLKNEDVNVRMHYINGNQDVLKSCMSVIAEQQASLNPPLGQGNVDTNYNSCLSAEFSLIHPLKIVQRMRLEPSQLEGVQRKLRQVNDFCMCLTLAAAPPLTSEAAIIGEQARMSKILCDGFIKYMQDKCAAGIINVSHPCTQQDHRGKKLRGGQDDMYKGMKTCTKGFGK